VGVKVYPKIGSTSSWIASSFSKALLPLKSLQNDSKILTPPPLVPLIELNS